jgi:hypothetical protein
MFRPRYSLLILAAGLLAFTPRTDSRAQAPAAQQGTTVILASGLADPDLIALSVNTATGMPDADFLMDTPRAETTLKPFLDRHKPAKMIRVGPKEQDAVAFSWSLFPKAEHVVVAPRAPNDLLLQAATLAGTMQAPLVLLADGPDPLKGLQDVVTARGTKEVFAVGAAATPCKGLKGVEVRSLGDVKEVTALLHKAMTHTGRVSTLVLANPADPKGTAALAPWIAVKHKAALLLTDAKGGNTVAVVDAALKEFPHADSLIVAADFDAIPTVKRDNPAAGKDEQIDVEPWMPAGEEPITLSSGRLFHPDRAIVPLMLAGQRRLEKNPDPPKVLIASNPGDGLPLLETFSRNTGRELQNAGYKVTGLYGKSELTGKELRELLPQHDIFLWEGHYRTLIDTYEMPKWTEQLRPSVIFLQSCLALNPAEGGLLFDRGAVAMVGSPNRTYSASGGAISLAFFDALAYEGKPIGPAMRSAKNFLICYSILKDKRLGDAAKLSGANKRAAWVFSVWGDPTLKLPKAIPPADALPSLQTEVVKNTIALMPPAAKYPATEVTPYRAEMWPGGRLAGLTTADPDASHRLVPLAFAEIPLLDGPAGMVPKLTSKLPGNNWVFRWDARRKVGYLLALPREKDGNRIEFKVKWEAPE